MLANLNTFGHDINVNSFNFNFNFQTFLYVLFNVEYTSIVILPILVFVYCATIK